MKHVATLNNFTHSAHILTSNWLPAHCTTTKVYCRCPTDVNSIVSSTITMVSMTASVAFTTCKLFLPVTMIAKMKVCICNGAAHAFPVHLKGMYCIWPPHLQNASAIYAELIQEGMHPHTNHVSYATKSALGRVPYTYI